MDNVLINFGSDQAQPDIMGSGDQTISDDDISISDVDHATEDHTVDETGDHFPENDPFANSVDGRANTESEFYFAWLCLRLICQAFLCIIFVTLGMGIADKLFITPVVTPCVHKLIHHMDCQYPKIRKTLNLLTTLITDPYMLIEEQVQQQMKIIDAFMAEQKRTMRKQKQRKTRNKSGNNDNTTQRKAANSIPLDFENKNEL